MTPSEVSLLITVILCAISLWINIATLRLNIKIDRMRKWERRQQYEKWVQEQRSSDDDAKTTPARE